MAADDLTVAIEQLDRLSDQLDLLEVDDLLVRRAAELARRHALRAFDAVHLAAAERVQTGATVLVVGNGDLCVAAEVQRTAGAQDVRFGRCRRRHDAALGTPWSQGHLDGPRVEIPWLTPEGRPRRGAWAPSIGTGLAVTALRPAWWAGGLLAAVGTSAGLAVGHVADYSGAANSTIGPTAIGMTLVLLALTATATAVHWRRLPAR